MIADDNPQNVNSVAHPERRGWGWRDIPPNASVTLSRLADQIDFFDKRSKENQNWYRRLKFGGLLFATLITLSVTLGFPAWAAPTLGGLVLLNEGYLALTSRHKNWLEYRSTCEALKHEKYLFLARASIYQNQELAEQLLAENIERILATDHSKWVETRKEEMKLPGVPPK
jgi:hypothetical protein